MQNIFIIFQDGVIVMIAYLNVEENKNDNSKINKRFIETT